MKLQSPFASPFQIELSFAKLIEDLEMLAIDPSKKGSANAKAILDKLSLRPNLLNEIKEVSAPEKDHELIGSLLTDYFPPALTHNEIKAINIPYTNIFFNLTERFKKIIKEAGSDFDMVIRNFDEHQVYVSSCCIILNEHYGTHFEFGKPIFYDIPNASGTIRHYRILYNADFLNLIPTEKAVSLTIDDIHHLMDNYHDLSLWKEKFPENSWILRGFAIMSLFDATIENSVSTLKEKFIGLRVADFSESLRTIFQSIYQTAELQLGFTGYNVDEDRFSLEAFGEQMHSYILKGAPDADARKVLGENIYQKLIIEKRYVAISDTSSSLKEENLNKCLSSQNIKSFILAPIVKNGNIMGVLEIVSSRIRELNTINAQNLQVVMPFLTDTIERLLFQMETQIQAVIQDNYTTIHKSVHWKFRDLAKKYIQNSQLQKQYSPEEIVFKDVYPLYGQIDIKGSSDIRNASVQKDLHEQLESLINILELTSGTPIADYATETEQLKQFKQQVSTSLKADTESQITFYLENYIHERLQQIQEPTLIPIISTYFDHCEKRHGYFHLNRRIYEESVTAINNVMIEIIDTRQNEAQAMFPHYYERFKTDGLEHNLYIGASIANKDSFSIPHLHYLRLWQLEVICEIERASHNKRSSMPLPLELRSLVLVSNVVISIRFRLDEKRFDVDGSYNARFEIIKKRIDKAYIKNTSSRIVETGKITIVYSNEAEETEYRGYLSNLKAKNLVEGEIEKYEVEDLRGISGLKIMRVKIVY